MNPSPTAQQLQEAGFDKRQAEALAAAFDNLGQQYNKLGQQYNKLDQQYNKLDQKYNKLDQKFDKLDKKMDAIMVLLQSMIRRMDATSREISDFQKDTERRFSEVSSSIADVKVNNADKISDATASTIKWMVGAIMVAAGGMYVALRDLLVNVLNLG